MTNWINEKVWSLFANASTIAFWIIANAVVYILSSNIEWKVSIAKISYNSKDDQFMIDIQFQYSKSVIYRDFL